MAFDILYNESENKNQGVLPGGLHDNEQIKVLICYLLSDVSEGVTSDFMCGVLQKCGSANYFEASHSFAELVSGGQIAEIKEGSNLYQLTDTGRYIVTNLADELPASVKESTLKNFKMYLHQYDVKQENSVKLISKQDRTYIECMVNDGDNQLLSVKMYIPDAEQAILVRNVFYNNTDVVYQAIVALMTGDKSTAIQVINSAEINTENFI